MIQRPRRSTLFPYTTLSRSQEDDQADDGPGDEQRDLQGAAPTAPTGPAGAARLDEHVGRADSQDRKSTRLNSSHANISYAVFCLKKKNVFHAYSVNRSQETV